MKMKIKICFLWLIIGLVWSLASAAENTNYVWKSDFSKTVKAKKMVLPEDWEISGTKWGVKDSVFNVRKNENGVPILHMSSEKGRGGLMHRIEGIDLNKTPIMKWKWLVIEFPKGGDGRFDDKGDQAIEIYVMSGSIASQKCLVYTWETETPIGAEDSFSVFLGAFKARWFCVRNKNDGTGKWFSEERNVAKDFKKTYGFIPEEIAVMVFCKSDMTKTRAEAELEWIEFRAAKKK